MRLEDAVWRYVTLNLEVWIVGVLMVTVRDNSYYATSYLVAINQVTLPRLVFLHNTNNSTI